ncbi:hypothetical protein HMI55_005799, partial [Coelomomyces lativittatus]
SIYHQLNVNRDTVLYDLEIKLFHNNQFYYGDGHDLVGLLDNYSVTPVTKETKLLVLPPKPLQIHDAPTVNI